MTPNCSSSSISLKHLSGEECVGLISIYGFFCLFLFNAICRGKICQPHFYFDYFTDLYLDYFTTPYFIFARDTLSYFLLLGLHFIICLSQSVVKFSVTEVAILVFFIGRFVVEFDQCLKNWPKETSSDAEDGSTTGENFRSKSIKSIASRMLTAYLR